MRQLPTPSRQEPEIVDRGGRVNPKVVQITKLFDSLDPADRRIVQLHVNGRLPLSLPEDPDELLTTAAAARLLEVSSPLVLRLADEGRLPPSEKTDSEYSDNPIYKFRRRDVLDFIASNGTGRALHSPGNSAAARIPEIDWEAEGKTPFDWPRLVKKLRGKYEKIYDLLPLEEIKPILSAGLPDLPKHQIYAIQGLLRGLAAAELAARIGRNVPALTTYYREGVDNLSRGIAGAKIKLIKRRFVKLYGHQREDDGDRASSSRTCRLCGDPPKEDFTIHCLSRWRPSAGFSIYDLVTQAQLDAMHVPIKSTGLPSTIVKVLASKHHDTIGSAYHYLGFSIPHLFQRHGLPPGAYEQLTSVYLKLGLIESADELE